MGNNTSTQNVTTSNYVNGKSKNMKQSNKSSKSKHVKHNTIGTIPPLKTILTRASSNPEPKIKLNKKKKSEQVALLDSIDIDAKKTMDVIDKLNSMMSSYSGKLDSLVGEDHKIDAIIIVYIILFLVIKPCKATEITKMPIIQLSMIASILYIARTNQVTATLLAVAFLITLGTNSHECNH